MEMVMVQAAADAQLLAGLAAGLGGDQAVEDSSSISVRPVVAAMAKAATELAGVLAGRHRGRRGA